MNRYSMRFFSLLFSCFVFSWVALWGSTAFAQQQPYLALCSSLKGCQAGLICYNGICVHECDTLQRKCPHGEPCRIQANGKGACVCNSSADCPAGHACSSSQCSGSAVRGELCDTTKPCAKNFFCSKPVDAKEKRCLSICTGAVCSDNSPCVSDPTSQISVCYCNENSHCPQGICINGVCKSIAERGEDCTRQIGCSNGLYCAFETPQSTVGRCHPRCNSGADCIGGEQCVLKGAVKVCLCDFASPCTTGFSCSNGFCKGFVFCDRTHPCPLDTVCHFPISSRNEGVCLSICTENKDCSDGTPCLPAANNKKACFCRSDDQCPGQGFDCQKHQCRAVCIDFRQCPFDKICKDNFCVTPGENDVLPERSPPEPVADAGVVDRPRRDTKPICDPVCKAPQTCNVKTRKCEKLGIGSACEKDDDCESGVCFGPGFPKPNICSLSDCSKCAEYALICQTHGGKKACYRRELVVPPAPPDKVCGCSSTAPGDALVWCLLLMLSTLVISRRKSA